MVHAIFALILATPSLAAAVVGKVKADNTAVYASASAESDTKGTLPAGAGVQVGAKIGTENGSWCRISSPAASGFVPCSALEIADTAKKGLSEAELAALRSEFDAKVPPAPWFSESAAGAVPCNSYEEIYNACANIPARNCFRIAYDAIRANPGNVNLVRAVVGVMVTLQRDFTYPHTLALLDFVYRNPQTYKLAHEAESDFSVQHASLVALHYAHTVNPAAAVSVLVQYQKNYGAQLTPYGNRLLAWALSYQLANSGNPKDAVAMVQQTLQRFGDDSNLSPKLSERLATLQKAAAVQERAVQQAAEEAQRRETVEQSAAQVQD